MRYQLRYCRFENEMRSYGWERDAGEEESNPCVFPRPAEVTFEQQPERPAFKKDDAKGETANAH